MVGGWGAGAEPLEAGGWRKGCKGDGGRVCWCICEWPVRVCVPELACWVWAHPLRRASGSRVWGRMHERVPVCLCIYEPRGGRRRRGGKARAAAAGHVEPRSGQAECPFPLAGLTEPAFQVHPQTAPPPPPVSRGLSRPWAHLPSLPGEEGGRGRLLPIPPGSGPTPPSSLGPPDTGAGGGGSGGRL